MAVTASSVDRFCPGVAFGALVGDLMVLLNSGTATDTDPNHASVGFVNFDGSVTREFALPAPSPGFHFELGARPVAVGTTVWAFFIEAPGNGVLLAIDTVTEEVEHHPIAVDVDAHWSLVASADGTTIVGLAGEVTAATAGDVWGWAFDTSSSAFTTITATAADHGAWGSPILVGGSAYFAGVVAGVTGVYEVDFGTATVSLVDAVTAAPAGAVPAQAATDGSRIWWAADDAEAVEFATATNTATVIATGVQFGPALVVQSSYLVSFLNSSIAWKDLASGGSGTTGADSRSAGLVGFVRPDGRAVFPTPTRFVVGGDPGEGPTLPEPPMGGRVSAAYVIEDLAPGGPLASPTLTPSSPTAGGPVTAEATVEGVETVFGFLPPSDTLDQSTLVVRLRAVIDPGAGSASGFPWGITISDVATFDLVLIGSVSVVEVSKPAGAGPVTATLGPAGAANIAYLVFDPSDPVGVYDVVLTCDIAVPAVHPDRRAAGLYAYDPDDGDTVRIEWWRWL